MTGCIAASTHPPCTPCDLGLDHCHALLIEHADGTYECLDGCGGPRAIHDDVLPDEEHVTSIDLADAA